MFLTNRRTIAIAVFILLCGRVSAQSDAVRLYPQPQSIEGSQQRFMPRQHYRVTGRIDADAMAVLKEILKIDSSKTALPFVITPVDKKNKQLQRSGAYRLAVTPEKITLMAYDERSVFYAVQTLRQLVQLNNSGEVTLPVIQITDYPDVAYRGTVEGFYGEPWSHTDRLEQLRFYGKLKLNTYIYGPKDDPYHSSPHWRKP